MSTNRFIRFARSSEANEFLVIIPCTSWKYCSPVDSEIEVVIRKKDGKIINSMVRVLRKTDEYAVCMHIAYLDTLSES